jgi:ribosomal peptide maturation radical SAM protein 1
MRIILVCMPFARVEFPSLALTQLKSRLEEQFGAKVAVEVHYLNHNFANFIGLEANQTLTDMSMNNGIGEWFFRQAAFPELPDNTMEFFQRTFPKRDGDARRFRQAVIEKRQKLGAFLQDMVDLYALDQADLIGFTSMFSQNVASIALARLVKQINPRTVTVVGGANCEYPMGTVVARNIACMDYVFSGPALKSFPQFVGHLLDGDRAACDRIPGIFSRTNVAESERLPPIGEELPIDTIIPLDYGPFLLSYARFGETHYLPCLLFETSRGCWWGEKAHCTFCGLNGLTMQYRAMDPALAVQQIQTLFDYAPQGAQLQSVDNILPKSYLTDVLPKLRTPLTTSLFYEVKSDLSDADFETLAQARVKFIQPGVEALSTLTLKLMKKGSTAFQNVALLKNCALHDIDPAWNLLVGFPGEPGSVFEKYMQDLPLMPHLPAPIGVAPVRFDRYSPYFTKAQDYGLALRPFDFYRLTYPFSEEEIADLAYYFYDDNVDAPYIVDLVDWIEPLRDVVATWRRNWLDLGVRPTLHLQQRGAEVVLIDSRSGSVDETPMSSAELRVLACLQRPRTEGLVRSDLAETGIDVAAVLETMRARRLLFTEGDRMLSLVLPRPPATPERRAHAHNPAAVA